MMARVRYMYFLTFSIKFNSAIKKGDLKASDFKMVVKERGFPVKTAGKLRVASAFGF